MIYGIHHIRRNGSFEVHLPRQVPLHDILFGHDSAWGYLAYSQRHDHEPSNPLVGFQVLSEDGRLIFDSRATSPAECCCPHERHP